MKTIFVSLFLMSWISYSAAQLATPEPVGRNGTPNLPSLRIGSNDLLNIVVYDSPELSGLVRVDAQGAITLPMLQQSIDAGGLYPRQLETRIADALSSSQLVVNPSITVTVAEYQSRTVSVTGAVHRPITFQAYGQVTLLDALARAEGVSETAGDVILVTDPTTDKAANSTAALPRRIDVKTLMSGNSPESNLVLHGGETVRVPEEGRISVVGNVRKPGLYPLHTQSEGTVLNLVAESEGLLPYTSKRAYIYRAEASGSAKNEIPVALAKIMDPKQPDVVLQAGDILYIPDDRNRRATLGTLDKLLTAGTVASSAVIYAGVH